MSEPIRLGLLRLCDAASVILADQEARFAAAGLNVVLSVEPSWANVADKLGYGLLDGAVMLAPLAIACAAGLRGPQIDLVVPMNLSLNGNAFTLASLHRERFLADGMAAVAAGKRLRLAVVHGFSSHDLLLRHWLVQQGVTPGRDVDITVLPPAEMVGSLAARAIDGFCAGAPWGLVAEQAGIGFNAVLTRDIWPGHPEKCLAMRADFCAADPGRLTQLLGVLLAADAACAVPEHRAGIAGLLAQPDYLDLPAALLAAALDPAATGPVFGNPYPDLAQAQWYARQMVRWAKAPVATTGVIERIYRPELLLAAGVTLPATAPVVLDMDEYN
jgi:ABC-type nitrate/sulfonate/bicarbonate transport system substrate-binding protein